MAADEDVDLVVLQLAQAEQRLRVGPEVTRPLAADGDQLVGALAEVVFCVGVGHPEGQGFVVRRLDVRDPVCGALDRDAADRRAERSAAGDQGREDGCADREAANRERITTIGPPVSVEIQTNFTP